MSCFLVIAREREVSSEQGIEDSRRIVVRLVVLLSLGFTFLFSFSQL
jgi:hypothetical protein